ncbi:hypothetical protein D3C78_1466930 [compost metagenome]
MYQPRNIRVTPRKNSPARPNQATWVWPNGMTMAAASSGPRAEPVLPPTWKVDCARPKRPPEASRAIREVSGWKVDEPMPTKADASRIIGKLPTKASITIPTNVHRVPSGNRFGVGRRSVKKPTQGCNSEAVIWNVSVIMPIWAKLRS